MAEHKTGLATPSNSNKSRRNFFRLIAGSVGLTAILVALPMLTPALNGLKPGGIPLGYAIVAHAIPLILAAWLAIVSWLSRHGS